MRYEKPMEMYEEDVEMAAVWKKVIGYIFCGAIAAVVDHILD